MVDCSRTMDPRTGVCVGVYAGNYTGSLDDDTRDSRVWQSYECFICFLRGFQKVESKESIVDCSRILDLRTGVCVCVS